MKRKTLALCILCAAWVGQCQTVPGEAATAKPLTSAEAVERIKANVGVPWQAETVDTFKAGNPGTRVTGIAVTMMTTLDVLKRAAAAGDNLIITHEPTFYDHLDISDQLPEGEKDAVLAEKRAFIKEHQLVIWRFHDHWHLRKPDGIQAGMVHALGWEKFQDPTNQHLFTIPETTVEQLGAYLTRKLGITALRTVGVRNMKVTRVVLIPGYEGLNLEAGALEMPDVQVLITGESREWEAVEYVADAVTEGRQKALILLSHVPSEQAGMEECTRWLKTIVTEVPVEFVPTADPFAAESTLTKR
jgi:putative NIF3 family GTP cyclohydrolase 1 type 2